MTVRFYESLNSSAPAKINNTAGKLTDVLDACLVNGYSIGTVSSITRSSSTATVTTSSAHGLRSLQRVTISGCDQSEYNGEHVITVTGASTFTYTVSGTPATPATGTITGAVTGAGWTIAFTAANKRVYRPPAGNQFYLRVDDTGTSSARFVGYESMSDVDTGTNAFPTEAQNAGGLYAMKSDASTLRAWKVFATDKFAYVWNEYSSSYSSFVAFGDFPSYKSTTDSYNTAIMGYPSTSIGTYNSVFEHGTSLASAIVGHFIARSYTGTGTSITAVKNSNRTAARDASIMGNGGEAYPSVVSGAFLYAPMQLAEVSTIVTRGDVPGLLNPLHTAASLATFSTGDTINLGSKTYLVLKQGSSAGMALVEITNGW